MDAQRNSKRGESIAARICVLILLVPIIFPLFGRIAALPIEVIIHSGFLPEEWKRPMTILQLIVIFTFGLISSVWISKKIWKGMGNMDTTI
jgi:hypothetical protein